MGRCAKMAEDANNIEYRVHISRADVKANPTYIFVFGDNDMRTGLGGLAREVRGEPNAFGIRVKKRPYRDWDAYYTDREYEDNLKKICDDINKIMDAVNSNQYSTIVFPKAGIGTGLADMQKRCPETFNAMNLILDGTLGIRNGDFK